MNTTVLALQEEQVLAAVGRPGAKPSVQALSAASYSRFFSTAHLGSDSSPPQGSFSGR